MKKYLDPFWMTVTTILCFILIVLLYPVVSEQYGVARGGVIVAGAVACIWIVYGARAYMFVRYADRLRSSSSSS